LRLLLDTHALIWAVDAPEKLGKAATEAIQSSSNQLYLGAGSIWELAIKISLDKLSLSIPFKSWIDRAMQALEVSVIPITIDHADAQAGLPWHHRDPFDRLLAAQAQVESLPLVSTDLVFDLHGVTQIW
jgi:PIN domain nuclease of toxin-antitoxin system